ncbi:hypothetical protein NP493_548g02057 [Ridgeia piscesae]|uniref:Endonuclease/exonuclease/phosphatase domain-containing protein n=1 Tax=Ridgeia piscesae TaxID=27915 RepID=A0AAD9KVX1_RIDPI|nr:hypothetical protein NP493_548g02057 [Ridgeia piscesae]
MKPIVICTFYRTPHDSQETQIEEQHQYLSKQGNKINTHKVIITSDFNLPNINWENHHVTANSGYRLIQLLPTNYFLSRRGTWTNPTRKQRNANNILDLN